jgi:hypothetical protein
MSQSMNRFRKSFAEGVTVFRVHDSEQSEICELEKIIGKLALHFVLQRAAPQSCRQGFSESTEARTPRQRDTTLGILGCAMPLKICATLMSCLRENRCHQDRHELNEGN